MTQQQIDQIVGSVAAHFRCFGGNREPAADNPLTHWPKDEPLQFALGVNVKDVVVHVIKEMQKTTRKGKR